ncbi:TetR/AcrR family transcriptional regulator C-terminal domain-containing protein [Frankia sp. AgB1.9]|uniref:TetR/AcrR family transcriptional regulator n=1 Tax=unclassified Frankia TaxID=2632575 RepID=UPI001933BEE6|nr:MULTISPECIES: TetR/AcrR family transcriptional regulator C-terminal domain-containing protein [unclassified Frankia]MBL7486820.1 TetR/AcrR family transcriptional regulator C-terminal domain-containing protein [Frankia sp. AgW1.1]MBL7549807.1 TetR/AcrR family transcriptional regulator C-terminal domain-containing protein [Frankia sp. AgB1.9]MBL7622883.1 TetR/AcrR family transcriptional regulator C-terminal domain-containing protein [Frankia sp. AgB1.8]
MSNGSDGGAATARPVRSRRRTDLSEREIVTAALRLVAREGADKLTMRGLAAELGLSSMASYYHVPSKTVLFDLVADAVLADVRVPDSEEPWEKRVREMFISARSELARYPGVAALLLSRTSETPNMRRLSSELRRALRQAGFGRAESDAFGEVFTIYLFGRLIFEARPSADSVAAAAEPDQAGTGAADAFETGLDLLLAGTREQLRTT